MSINRTAASMDIGGSLRFGWREAEEARQWKFNCGPAALCAVLGMTPAEIRPHLLEFEAKGYANPLLMANILHGLGVRFLRVYECPHRLENKEPIYPRFGLVRVQWGGPWTKPGVPMRARYRYTHWVAVSGPRVFDINAIGYGGWLPWPEWSQQLVPWLIREAVPRGDETWWPTHCWEVAK